MRCPLTFFLQAEDGIRHLPVTGVQTCALPISVFIAEYKGKTGFADGIRCDEDGNVWAGMGWAGDGYDGRSEERRVGRARRSRGTVRHEKSKSTRSPALGRTSLYRRAI